MGNPTVGAERAEKLLERVSALLSGLRSQREDRLEYSIIRLAAPPEADYSFAVWVHGDGQPGISAQLVSSEVAHQFWARLFAPSGWRSLDARDDAFVAALDGVVNSRSRITQVRGWLFWHFTCAFQTEDEWRPIGGISPTRWTPGVPAIQGRSRHYYSPRLERAA
jgi:hypothetical protein